MPFNFSFSSSATFVSTSSVNGGQPQGWAYRREAYSTNDGSGVRTTKQKLGEAPITQMRMYDAQGRPLLTQGNDSGDASRHQSKRGPSTRIISIEDVTEEEEKKAQDSGRH